MMVVRERDERLAPALAGCWTSFSPFILIGYDYKIH